MGHRTGLLVGDSHIAWFQISTGARLLDRFVQQHESPEPNAAREWGKKKRELTVEDQSIFAVAAAFFGAVRKPL